VLRQLPRHLPACRRRGGHRGGRGARVRGRPGVGRDGGRRDRGISGKQLGLPVRV
jgi:hypothetical protein